MNWVAACPRPTPWWRRARRTPEPGRASPPCPPLNCECVYIYIYIVQIHLCLSLSLSLSLSIYIYIYIVYTCIITIL